MTSTISPHLPRTAAAGRARFFACAVASAVLLGPLSTSTAFAADSNAETSAVQLFGEGRQAFDKKQYARAVELLESSLRLVPSPNTRLYIGRSLRELGKTASAHTALTRAASEAHDAVATGQARYRATEEAATKEAQALESTIPHVVVNVPGDVPNAVVTLDGSELPSASRGLKVGVDPGPHVVKATAPRRRPFEQTFEIAPGGDAAIDVKMEPSAFATVRVKLDERPSGFSVSLDGAPIDVQALAAPLEVEPGSHTLTVRAPGRTDFVWTATVANEEAVEVIASLPATPMSTAETRKPFPKAPFFVAGGLAVAALGTGAALGVIAKTTSDSEQSKPANERSLDERDKVKSLATQADILFIAGGTLLIGTAVLGWFTWRDVIVGKKKKETAHVVPWMGPQGLGIAAGGSF